VYTHAQFDNFELYGNPQECPTPSRGQKVQLVNCGGMYLVHIRVACHDRAAPNEANTQWLFSNGAIKLKSNPTLCMTGPTGHTAGPTQLTIEPCEEGNPGQSFFFHNETFYPTTLVSQGSYTIGLPKLSATGSTWPGDGVYAFKKAKDAPVRFSG
jgi:hypothetical protein